MIHYTSGILYSKSDRVNFREVNLEEVVDNLIKEMKRTSSMSMSAPQIGILKNICLVGNPNDFDQLFVIINPKLVSTSEEEIMLEESCASFPGLILKVKRPKEISVRFQNMAGTAKTVPLSGITARLVQHEIDHLNGICFWQRVSPISLKMACKKRKLKYEFNRIQKALG